MKVLYFDCPAGLSGDMALGALLGLGLDEAAFRSELNKLGINDEFALEVKRSEKCGVAGTAVRVHLAYEHEHEHPAGHGHRKLGDIVDLICGSALDTIIKDKAIGMFRLLAQAEGAVHGIPPEEVTFHEVGAVDSIVDIVGTCVAMRMVGAGRVVFSALNTGSGSVKCAHGVLPVPAPATLEILKGVPCYSDGTQSELTTPTGALIARTFAEAFGPMPEMAVESVGYGLGSKDFAFPNAARAIIGRVEPGEERAVCVVECNIDDMPGEAAGYALEKLFAAGALDAFFTPIQMKKNRPAFMLTAICSPDKRENIERTMLTETTTLGVRVHEARRATLRRRNEAVETPWGNIRVKIADGPEGPKLAPEYEDCRAAALSSGRPFLMIYAEAVALARNKFL
jgi:uncharacterized protein (TIGR00299 family) protein